MPVEKTCEVCGAKFKVPPCRAETARTCSKACKYELFVKDFDEKRVKSNCLTCSKEIRVPTSRAERGNGKYCSKACAYKGALNRKYPQHEKPDGVTYKHSNGYIIEKSINHPYAVNKCVLQHRLRIEERMREEVPEHSFLIEIDGTKYLRRDIEVHHIDEDKKNNSIDNLVACTPAAHRDMHDGRLVMEGTTYPEPEKSIKQQKRIYYFKCEICKSTFSRNLADLNRGRNTKYCSRQCKSVATTGSDLPSRVERECIVCGVKFIAKKNVVLNGGAKFCSTKCYHESKIGVSPHHVHEYPQLTN